MPMARQYQTFEVRAMLQSAEGVNSPLTGAPAHSRVLHAQATPGGQGITPAAMMLRTHKQPGESNSQFANRGGATRTSSFGNLLQQADAVCQALNSQKGQAALQVFDRAPNIPGGGLRATIDFGPIKQIGFLSGSGAAPMKTVSKSDAAIQKPASGAAGIRVILDRHADKANGFHIQTCMPLDTLAACKYDVKNGNVSVGSG